MPDLFNTGSGEEYRVKDGRLRLVNNFLPDHNHRFKELACAINWRQDSIVMGGKPVLLPRLQAWYGDNGAKYSYSKLQMNPENWIEPLLEIKKLVDDFSQQEFNSVLCNLYRNESDSVGWHADDEPELGQCPVIASISLGATRRIEFRHIKDSRNRFKLDLEGGSLLVMSGKTQHYWHHQVPKEQYPCEPRINLTFRYIQPA